MTRRAGHLLFSLVLTGGLTADLLSKHFVFKFLSVRGPYDVWPGVFRLRAVSNRAGPFSLLREVNGSNWLLASVTVLALVIIFYFYLRSVRGQGGFSLVALSMIAAGALGNLVDRVHGGQVRDFLDVCIINYPVFNVADILITVGAGILIVQLFRGESERGKRDVKPKRASD